MKVIISLIIIIFSLSIFANNTKTQIKIKSNKIKCTVENYELCLSHENPGVVESALSNIIKFRYRCPEANIECILKQLKVLSNSDNNEKICKKALLVLYILQNPDLVSKIGDYFYSDVDQFLDVILLSTRFEATLSAMLDK